MGAGAIGGILGGHLALGGARVTLIARGDHLRALEAGGLRLLAGTREQVIRVPATGDPEGIGAVDLVVFAVKAYDAADAAELIRPLLHEQTTILSIQNGVDHLDALAASFGPQRVLGGVCWTSAQLEAPGVVRQLSPHAEVRLGTVSGSHQLLEEIAYYFNLCEIPATAWPHGFAQVLWTKFMFNCAYNGLTALLRAPMGAISTSPDTWTLYLGLMREVQAVAVRHGVPISEELFAETVRFHQAILPTSRASMAYDLERGHRLENEALCGTVCRLGRRHGVPTPLNQMVYSCLQPFAQGETSLAQQIGAVKPVPQPFPGSASAVASP